MPLPRATGTNNDSKQVSKDAYNALLDRAELVKSVTDYGATGNGTTDDSSAIQSALDAVEAAGGGTLYFPPGTYIIGTGLSLSLATDGSLFTRLQGSSTLLKTNSAIDILTISNTAGSSANTRRVIIDGLVFSANNASARSLVLTNACYNQFCNLDFLGIGTAIICGSAVNDRNIGNQFNNIRIVHAGTGVLISGMYNTFTNLLVMEELQGGPYAIQIEGQYCVVDGFVVRGIGGVGGTAAINITNSAAGSVLANGIVFDSYAIGVAVSGARHVKVVGVTIAESQTHGLQLSGALQGRFDVTIQDSSNASAGTYHNIHCLNTPTDNIITAQFVGTGPGLDINEASGTNNVWMCGTLPNGKTISSSSVWIAAGTYGLGPNQLLGAQGAAIADATDAATAISQLNLALAAMRTHGLIDT